MRHIAPSFFALLVALASVLVGRPPLAQAAGPAAESFVEGEVVPSVDAFWRQESLAAGRTYVSPRIVLVSGRPPVYDACGPGAVQSHEYCAADRTIYLDVSTRSIASFGSLWERGQEFAIVTVAAHEWGHYIQDLDGVRGTSVSQIQLEQQADCLSGVFAHYAETQGWLDPGDLESGELLALESGGPSHGRGWDRVQAFNQGYQSVYVDERACTLR